MKTRESRKKRRTRIIAIIIAVSLAAIIALGPIMMLFL